MRHTVYRAMSNQSILQSATNEHCMPHTDVAERSRGGENENVQKVELSVI